MSRILLADDHAVVRIAVRMLLENAGHTVVAEVGCGVDVVLRARELEPDLIVLDIDMPRLDGIGVLQRLCGNGQAFRVVVFSGLSAEQYAVRCSRAGASGFVSKGDDLTELLKVIQFVLAGYSLFPERARAKSGAVALDEAGILSRLSARELSVLRYLAKGYRIKDIAEELVLSSKTASSYKARLIEKLEVDNAVELVELAKRNNLV